MNWRRGAACLALLCPHIGINLGQAAAPGKVQDTRRSGYDFMSPATQALQRDDMLNPAMLWLAQGRQLWSAREGKADKSCTDCHAAPIQSMRGVAARYPAFDESLQRPVTLAQRIDQCRIRHQQTSPDAPESERRLALEVLVANASRGLPIKAPSDGRLEGERERGRRLFQQRFGQLDLACAQCHDGQAGRKLAGSTIPQAHPGGYPIYRLEWQGIGSLQRRMRGCMSGVRAEPFAIDAAEWVAMELFLMQRANGLPIETPGVRP